jgi:hypothetical protein
MEQEVKIEVDEVEIGDQQSVLHKVADLYVSHLLSDINLVVGDIKYPTHRGEISGEFHGNPQKSITFSCFQ